MPLEPPLLSSGCEAIEDFNDVKNTVFVAVGENVRESKSRILWTLHNFSDMRICFLHVNQPAKLITLLDDRFSMHKILNEYSLTLSKLGVQAGMVWIEANDVEAGIVQMIEMHRVQWLVMGAASEKLYSKRNGSTLPHESQQKLVQSLSAMFLEGPQGLSSSDLQERLGYASKDAEKSKQKAFEESIKRWRAEEDANEAFNKGIHY